MTNRTTTVGNETEIVLVEVPQHQCDMDTGTGCRNDIGGYQCDCRLGYIINGDGKTCAGIRTVLG